MQPSMLLSQFLETVYIPARLRGKSQNSVRLYRLCVRQFTRTLVREPKVADLTEENVLLHLSKRSNVAPATRNKELTQLLAMWRLAAQKGILSSWPDIKPEHEPQRDPIAWMPDELDSLFRTISRMDCNVDGVPSRLWWSSLVRVILDTGERIGAVMAMEWDWIQGEWLRVPAEHRKGKTRDRSYRLSIETLGSLMRLKQQNASKQVFPWSRNKNYLWRCYAKIVQDSGLPTGRKYQFHALRKTVGSAVYAAGLDPQDALDHSDRRTTQRYLDPRFTRDRQPCDVLAEYLQNPKKRGESGRKTG